ncbi:MAG: DUF2344 domain-containing protein, partial [Candidatus Dadabacteria bacterium]
KERSVDRPLPWDHIDCGIPKRYFIKEWKRAQSFRETPDCLTQNCSVCGVCDYDSVRNVLFSREKTENRIVPLGGSSDNTFKRPLPRPQKIRILFSKEGESAYIGHLELSKVFFRTLRQASIPLAFSAGFNPKPKIIFGYPLELGIESLCEYVDIIVNGHINTDSLIAQCNEKLPRGFRLLSAFKIPFKSPSLQSSITAQRYRAKLIERLKGKMKLIHCESKVWQSRKIEKVRKGKARSITLGSVLKDVTFTGDEVYFTILHTPSSPSIKPSEALLALTGLALESFQITKTSVQFQSDFTQLNEPPYENSRIWR